MDSQKVALLKDLLSGRRSVRSFSDNPLSLAILDTLLHAGQGQTSADGKRTAPSAHALYPLTLRAVIRRVEELASGVFTYDSYTGQLSRCENSICNGLLKSAALGNETWLEDAPVVIAIVAARETAIHHFAAQQADGLRGARYVDFEAGASVQNMYLAATAAGLGGVVVMGFDDIKMREALGLEPEFFPIALFCVGYPIG